MLVRDSSPEFRAFPYIPAEAGAASGGLAGKPEAGGSRVGWAVGGGNW